MHPATAKTFTSARQHLAAQYLATRQAEELREARAHSVTRRLMDEPLDALEVLRRVEVAHRERLDPRSNCFLTSSLGPTQNVQACAACGATIAATTAILAVSSLGWLALLSIPFGTAVGAAIGWFVSFGPDMNFRARREEARQRDRARCGLGAVRDLVPRLSRPLLNSILKKLEAARELIERHRHGIRQIYNKTVDACREALFDLDQAAQTDAGRAADVMMGTLASRDGAT